MYRFVILAISSFFTSIPFNGGQSHGVMPTIAAPILDKIYMIDIYLVKDDPEKRLFWADHGLRAIASSDLQASKPKNILDLPSGERCKSIRASSILFSFCLATLLPSYFYTPWLLLSVSSCYCFRLRER